MNLLALEFSSPQRSVAVLRDEFPESPNNSHAHEIIESGATANASLAMIEKALRASTLEREQIECIVVGLGPGSYTGIRAAISLVQGWQLARPIKILGLSSAAGIAAQAQAEGARGCVQVIVDAQREEFYIAGYDLAADGCREIEPLRIVPKTEILRRIDAGEILFGPEVSRWFPTGKTVFPRAATLARLALSRADFIPGEKLEPIYLRETQFVKAPPPRIIP